jgi:deazaflavin-dependent oxidoreductase (nitroreductase family)
MYVRYLDRPEGFVVWGIGSGSPRDPDWFENLRAAPTAAVQVMARRMPVRRRELTGQERDSMWRQVSWLWHPRLRNTHARPVGPSRSPCLSR